MNWVRRFPKQRLQICWMPREWFFGFGVSLAEPYRGTLGKLYLLFGPVGVQYWVEAMNPAAFGATTRLPLADCPFKRSALTVADAEIDQAILRTEPAVSLCPLPDITTFVTDELILHERIPEPRLQALIYEAGAIEDALEQQTLVPRAFWQRLQWLRQGAGDR